MAARRLMPRMALILPVGLLLLGGLGAGLARLGWQMDPLSARAAALHGPLMISGFMGTLISLERAVALTAIAPRYHWGYLAPAASALGGVLLLLAGNSALARGLLLGGSLCLLALFGVMLRRHRVIDVAIMALGALFWVLGNLLWVGGRPVYEVVHWWSAFLILTVVGERLELSRITRPSGRSRVMLLGAIALYGLGIILTRFVLDMGARIEGIGLILMAVWLLRYDVARHTIRKPGLPRFAAVCLLGGYAWLGVGGLLGLVNGAVYAGPLYEAFLHALLLGFIFSMVFAHAPIILPALTGIGISFHPVLYGHFVLLQLGLVYRLYGDLTGQFEVRQWGGMLNTLAILLFLVVTIGLLIRGRRQAADQAVA